jgi:hypothetical protein
MDKKTQLFLDTIEHLEYVMGITNKIVGNFAANKEFEANNYILKFIDEINITIEAINITKDMQTNSIDTNEINEALNPIIEALENQDFVLISDLFEYEIFPILERWKDELIKSKEKIDLM